ncbi:V-set and immunoglobulin domain-containing protein 4-like isoform X2 [Emydura macquarii macquarii]|uniref:V-set and immunoglobulin domain-containing protein 4-like isoform X2 n=1 Tax=Emydura macquarii macquarii TaxID=1129001 RepID=UPI00352B5509
MEKLLWLVALVNSFAVCSAILELSGTHDLEGTWKSSITLPCVYGPSRDFVQQTVVWTLDRDQSSGTIFRRDSSGDHIMLSRYRERLSVPKYKPGDVSLEIENLEIPDSGHYTCKVTWRTQNNSLLTKERTTTVKVVKVAVTKPIIRPGNLGFTVPKGARTSLTCSASGSPPIIYRWFKGEPGGNATRVSNHAVLMFDSLQTSDTGKYFCEAENRALSQVVRQSDAVQLTVRDLTKPATTVPSSEGMVHTTAKAVSERDLNTIPLATGSDVQGPEKHEVTKDSPYEVTYCNSMNDTRRQTCSAVNGQCNHQEAKPMVENNYVTEPMKENDYETIIIGKNVEYETLVNAMESEYELGDVE